MSPNPDAIRSQRFAEIGNFIKSKADEIVGVWAKLARREQESAEFESRTILRDHLPLFLTQMGDQLCSFGLASNDSAATAARIHGEERWRHGWRLDELIEDYQLLRIVLIDYVAAGLNRKLLDDETKSLSVFIDDAIKSAVVTYVAAQDHFLSKSKTEAEAANKLKSEFVANVSHEIRTPMNAILGLTELALEEKLESEVRDFIETAHQSAKSLLIIINDLLDFSRMEAGKLSLEQTQFDLWETIDETAKALSNSAAEKGLELLSEMCDGVPRYVVGDAMRLRQVISNLVSNAVKFTNRGEVLIRTSLVESGQSHAVVQFSVSDTGIGISAEDRNRIFTPFTQADASTTRLFGGSGLGLTICSELIKQFDGKLELESELRKGSNFFFSAKFEFSDPPPEVFSKRLSQTDSLNGMRILIVDDNATNRMIMERMLSQLKAHVDSLDNVDSALEKMRTAVDNDSGYDIVLVDALMPGRDGFSFVEAVDDDDSLNPTKILMLSSADRSLFTDRGIGLSVDAFLDKPVSRQQLLKVLTAKASTTNTDEPASTKSKNIHLALNVLVVEDIPANQKLVQAIVRKRGHSVTLANNGREGIEKILDQSFDAVLMDIQMPIVDGYQAAQAIRKLDNINKSKIPIIAMTANAMKGDAEKCIKAGMSDYISKPIDSSKLIKVVEKWGFANAIGRQKELGESTSNE